MDIIKLSYWEEQRLREQVRAVRHLPPNTWLPTPPYQPDRDLFADLLRLPDETNPVQWLKENNSNQNSCVLLWVALDRIRSYWVVDHRRVQSGEQAFSDDYAHWLGNLLDLPEDAVPFQQLTDTYPTTVPPELLRAVFQGLRVLRSEGSARPAVDVTSDDEILLLLDDLFRLPEGADPLQRIRAEHGDLAAIQTLRHVLAQIRPPHTLIVGRELKSYQPDTRLRAGELFIVLNKVVFRTTGFTLNLRTRIPQRLIRTHEAISVGRGVSWQSVERVVDNLGYHYLVYSRLMEGGTHWRWWYDLSLQLECYPAIPPTATIILSSNATSLVIMGFRPGELQEGSNLKPRPLQHMPLGDLTWHVKVAE